MERDQPFLTPIAEPQLAEMFEDDHAAAVAILLSTEGERTVMREAADELDQRGISHETHLLDPHQFPARVGRFAERAALRGIRVIIASSGRGGLLPTLVAAYTDVPVIGVPISGGGPLGGIDALLAIAQSGPGAPVACMAVDGARDAAIFAAHILSSIPLPPSDGE